MPNDSFRLTDESISQFDVGFGSVTTDYDTYRARYPSELFDRLTTFGVGTDEQRVLDLGAGTGFLSEELHQRGCDVVGLDIDRALLSAAHRDNCQEGVPAYIQAGAERIPFQRSSFGVVTAGQCWHWFDREQVISEIQRVVTSDGQLVITHFDWLPRNHNVAAQTERLILEWTPEWPGANGDGFYPAWTGDLIEAGFQNLETFSFEVPVEYSHEAWRGRIRASAGVGGSLPDEEIRAFDRQLNELLASSFPNEPLEIPHRSFTIVCTVP